MTQLTPMAAAPEDSPEGMIHISPNQGFNAGGAPVFSAVDEEPVPSPPVPRFRVLEDRQIAMNNHRFTLRANKEIDSSNYDIALLKRQGVKLEPIA